MSADHVIRVVLVDDQELFRVGVTVVIDAQPDMQVVGQAGNGADGVTLTRQLRPDIVLMDLRMPVMDGVEATRQIVRDRDGGPAAVSAPRVIVMTTFDLDRAAAESIRNGASGFLLKGATPEMLCATIRTVHDGNEVLAPGKLHAVLELIHGGEATPEVPHEFTNLTEREREVFRAASLGLSNAEIAQGVYLSESTVKTHISSILNKLGLRDRVQIVVFANKYRLAP
jgi:DNA-binding NarL/FixJ family response regulator